MALIQVSMCMNPNDQYPAHFAEKYQGIPFVLLDIPKIVPDEIFNSLWPLKSIPIVRKKPDERYPYSPEEAQRVYEETLKYNEYTMPNWIGITAKRSATDDDRWTESLIDGPRVLPKLFEQLNDLLPYSYISYVVFWSNQQFIGVHRDRSEQYPFMSACRVMIKDENPEPTFFMEKFPDDLDKNFHSKLSDMEKAKFVDFRGKDTNTVMYNNKSWGHGALKLPGYSKILCSLAGRFDWKKYETLIDRSLAKYGNNL
jgi:hypothetical protein